MNTRNPVGWFEIYVADMPRAKRFYEAVFHVTLTKLNSTEPSLELYAFPGGPDAKGATGALARMEGGPAGGAGTIVYFASEDCAIEAARAEAAGGSVMKSKFSIGEYGHIALLIDTEGNVVGVHSFR